MLTERKVIREERRSRVDNDPSSLLQEQMMAALYIAHPYHTPVIGWDTEIRGLTREDALRHYKKFYAPNNAILVVTGDVDPEQVVALAKDTYGKIPANPEVGQPRARPAEPEPLTERRVILRDGRVGKATFERYYLAPSFNTAKDREAEALQLLARIIGSSNTSRLYNALVRDEKKASSASAWYGGLALDTGRFGFYAVAAGDTKLEDIEASVDKVIDEVIHNGVTPEELERAKTTEIANLIYASDSQQSLAQTYGWNLATGRTVEDVEARPERLKAVTREDVQAVAAKYLDRKRSVTGYLIPAPLAARQSARRARFPKPGPSIKERMNQHDKKDYWEPASSADHRSGSRLVAASLDRTSSRRHANSKNRQQKRHRGLACRGS